MKKEFEQGNAKKWTSKMRLGSQLGDLIPIDLIAGVATGGIGAFIVEMPVAALAALSAGVDAVDKAINGDIKGAGEEIAMGVADTAFVMLPLVEWLSTFTNLTPGPNLRDRFRKAGGHIYNNFLGRESSVFIPEEDEVIMAQLVDPDHDNSVGPMPIAGYIPAPPAAKQR